WMGPGLCTQLPHESHGSSGQGSQGPLESPGPSPGLDPTTLFPAQPGLPRRTQTSSSLTSSTGSRAPHTPGPSACAPRTSRTSRTSLLDHHLASSS
ncbi:unnamed protein product, partial [Gulo gulo]